MKRLAEDKISDTDNTSADAGKFPKIMSGKEPLDGMEADTGTDGARMILAQLKNENGDLLGSSFNLPLSITVDKLQLICNALLQKEESQLYSFFVNEREIISGLAEALDKDTLESCESVVEIVYQPQAVFRVRAVTRCSSSITGHAEPILAIQFSPSGRYLASGSGDRTVRFWDINTETPQYTCEGHKGHVLCVVWSPDGNKLASGCKAGEVKIWDPKTGKQIGRTLTGHRQWIMGLCWKPLHLDGSSRLLASASKDTTIKIWDTVLGQALRTLSSHLQSVMCLRWSGANLIYSASQDRTIKVWRPDDGILCRTLEGHGHWANYLALNTDYVMRTGAYDPANASIVHTDHALTEEEVAKAALERYNSVIAIRPERLVSCSDDHTMFLWDPSRDKKPLSRLTGHQQTVIQVQFSPDGRLIASASFDKSVKLWNSLDGKFITTLRGHIQRVYEVAWSADSRLLCSSSADSTVKVWDIKTKKLLNDLPGHADEVYAVDWSPDGQRVASGGKDKVLKIWRR